MRLDDDGCVRLRLKWTGLEETSVLWLHGWTAQPTSDGVVIRDPSGARTLRTGEPVELPGGFLQEGRDDPQPCATGPAWQVVG